MPAKAAAKPAAKKKPDPKSNKAGGAKSKKKKWTKVHTKSQVSNAVRQYFVKFYPPVLRLSPFTSGALDSQDHPEARERCPEVPRDHRSRDLEPP